MARYVVKLGPTFFALHPDENTMFLTFRHREHAEKTMGAIKYFICTHKTLPSTCSESTEPLRLGTNDETMWTHCMNGLYIDEINKPELYNLCATHNGGALEVQDMKDPITDEGVFRLSYTGSIYEPVEVDIDIIKSYLEYLL